MQDATEIRAIVGYHNYFNVGAFEAAALVTERCPKGWRGFVHTGGPLPQGAVRVGQVKVHSGDQAYPLYAYPIRG